MPHGVHSLLLVLGVLARVSSNFWLRWYLCKKMMSKDWYRNNWWSMITPIVDHMHITGYWPQYVSCPTNTDFCKPSTCFFQSSKTLPSFRFGDNWKDPLPFIGLVKGHKVTNGSHNRHTWGKKLQYACFHRSNGFLYMGRSTSLRVFMHAHTYKLT